MRARTTYRERINRLPWRWLLALIIFLCGLAGFMSGVEVSERDLSDAGAGTLIYYTMGLFILGGMDLGPPVRGPAWGQVLLWVGYFGAPLLTTSAIVDWLRQLMRNQRRWLQKLDDHIILIGTGDVAQAILEKLTELYPIQRKLVIDRDIDSALAAELVNRYRALPLKGDFTNDYFLSTLGIDRARLIVVTGSNDFDSFETASKLRLLRPDIGDRLIIHCNKIRFMRQFSYTRLVRESIVFNSYQLAARHLVKNVMMAHFEHTRALDTVILAGFGRFGQVVFEELQALAGGEIADIGIIDLDANRRILVTEEQIITRGDLTRHGIEGNISNPLVWHRLEEKIDLRVAEPLVLFSTGADDENLRTALWLKKKHPNAKIMVRSARPSVFANDVADDTGIYSFGTSQVVKDALPLEWFAKENNHRQAAAPLPAMENVTHSSS